MYSIDGTVCLRDGCPSDTKCENIARKPVCPVLRSRETRVGSTNTYCSSGGCKLPGYPFYKGWYEDSMWFVREIDGECQPERVNSAAA